MGFDNDMRSSNTLNVVKINQEISKSDLLVSNKII